MNRTTGSDHHARPFAILALIALSLLAPKAFGAPTAAEKETARALMKSGREKRKSGDLRGALDDFTKARAIMNVTTTGLELGKAQRDLGLLVEARDTLLDVARSPETANEPKPLSKARDEAKQLAQDILPRIPAARIELRGAPVTAKVTVAVDGTTLVKESLGTPLKLNPGDHVVNAELGDRAQKVSFSLREGESKDVAVDVSSLVAIKKPPPPPRTSLNVLVPIGFATAGAGVIVGSVTGGLAIAKYNAVTPQCVDSKCPPATFADIDAGRRLGTTSTIAFVIAGVGAGVGVVGLLLPRKVNAPAPASALISPWIGAGSAGIRGLF